jgi:hypothetical protein
MFCLYSYVKFKLGLSELRDREGIQTRVYE